MYVCICNALTDSEFKQAIKEGADTVEKAFEAHGCQLRCARCQEEAEKLIQNTMLILV